MGFLLIIAASFLVAIASYYAYRIIFLQQKPDFPRDGWFGRGSKRVDATMISPFTVEVPEEVLEDLSSRLASSRISHEVLEDANSFEYGFNANYLKELIEYWQTQFDWRKQEAILNTWPQFTTEIEGLKVHFYHAKPDASKYKKVVPLLLVHGWPGNVFEFHKIIPMLLDPVAHNFSTSNEIAFEIIAPSIPGYGFSDSPKKTGFSHLAAARVFKKLMERVGHRKFYLQGGDWGSIITSQLARMYPESVFGLHLNMVNVTPFSFKGLFYTVVGSIFPQYLFKHKHHFNQLHFFTEVVVRESGYAHIQATKPDTVGAGLNDSPVGLAAYILEKFSTWTNREYKKFADGGLTKKFTLDELLTIVTIYWTQGNIVASQRFYKEFFADPHNLALVGKCITVPTAHAHFPNELFDSQPAELLATGMNLISQEVMPDGGLFGAFEHPAYLAAHLFSFVSELERNHTKTSA